MRVTIAKGRYTAEETPLIEEEFVVPPTQASSVRASLSHGSAAAVASRPSLSIVIPAYNERERLTISLPVIDAYLRTTGIDAEILVVDDGSTDATAELAETLVFERVHRVISLPINQGKGAAVRRGVLAARGEWVLVSDADLSTPIDEYDRLVAIADAENLDVVIGSRALPGSRVEVSQHIVRRVLGETFNLILRNVTGLPYRDTQCGFKLLRRSRVQAIFAEMVINGFAFDVELLYLCERRGLRVKEVPVTWRNSPRSTVSIIRSPPKMLFDLMRLRWRFRSRG
jgi:glycosyltransferase involved in cell wall biosynthesis